MGQAAQNQVDALVAVALTKNVLDVSVYSTPGYMALFSNVYNSQLFLYKKSIVA